MKSTVHFKVAGKNISSHISSLRPTTLRPTTLRPTTGLVREALFNMLATELELLSTCEEIFFIDLFAGSGAVGIAALQSTELPGKPSILFVEKDKKRSLTLQKKLSRNSAWQQNNIRVWNVHYAKALQKLCSQLKTRQPSADKFFPVLFADPPYFCDFYCSMLLSIQKFFAICGGSGLLILEHHVKETLQYEAWMQSQKFATDTEDRFAFADFNQIKKRCYGETSLLFYRFQDSQTEQ